MTKSKIANAVYAVYREEYGDHATPLTDGQIADTVATAIEYVPTKTFTDAVRVALTKIVPTESLDERMNER